MTRFDQMTDEKRLRITELNHRIAEEEKKMEDQLWVGYMNLDIAINYGLSPLVGDRAPTLTGKYSAYWSDYPLYLSIHLFIHLSPIYLLLYLSI